MFGEGLIAYALCKNHYEREAYENEQRFKSNEDIYKDRIIDCKIVNKGEHIVIKNIKKDD